MYFFFLPFQFALSPKEGIDLAIIRLLTLALVLWFLGQGLFRKKIILPPLLPLFFLSGFLFVASGSILWSENAGFAFRKILFLLSFLPFFIVISSWFEEFPATRSTLLKFFTGGAFLAAGSGIALFCSQFLFGLEKTYAFLMQNLLPFFLGTTFARSVAEHPSLLVNISGDTILRSSGVFPDPHMFAFYLGMASPLALTLSFTAVLPKERRAWMVVFFVILLADLLTFSRGGYVGLLCAGVFFVFGSGFLRRLNFRQKGVTILLSLVFLLALFSSPFGTRFFSSFSHEDGSNVERLRLWGEAYVSLGERPFLGAGLGNYSLLVKPSASYRDPIYAHNLYLDIALEIGFVGLFFFLGLLGIALFYSFRRWHQEHEWLSLGVVASLIVFLTHSLFETPLFSVHVLPALLLILAVGVSYRYEKTLV